MLAKQVVEKRDGPEEGMGRRPFESGGERKSIEELSQPPLRLGGGSQASPQRFSGCVCGGVVTADGPWASRNLRPVGCKLEGLL